MQTTTNPLREGLIATTYTATGLPAGAHPFQVIGPKQPQLRLASVVQVG